MNELLCLFILDLRQSTSNHQARQSTPIILYSPLLSSIDEQFEWKLSMQCGTINVESTKINAEGTYTHSSMFTDFTGSVLTEVKMGDKTDAQGNTCINT